MVPGLKNIPASVDMDMTKNKLIKTKKVIAEIFDK